MNAKPRSATEAAKVIKLGRWSRIKNGIRAKLVIWAQKILPIWLGARVSVRICGLFKHLPASHIEFHACLICGIRLSDIYVANYRYPGTYKSWFGDRLALLRFWWEQWREGDLPFAGFICALMGGRHTLTDWLGRRMVFDTSKAGEELRMWGCWHCHMILDVSGDKKW